MVGFLETKTNAFILVVANHDPSMGGDKTTPEHLHGIANDDGQHR
jgi:hypothetical protein